MSEIVKVSVVAPMHNEEENVEEFFRRVRDTLTSMKLEYEIILVDDGSTDGTREALRRIVQNDPRTKVVLLTRNFGQCPALYAGLQESVGEWVVVMDSDLQHRPEEIPLLVGKAMEGGYDIVSGRREGRQESLLTRRIPSWIANCAIRWATGCPAHDMGGFKCIRGNVARELRLFPGQHRFLPALVYLQGGSIAEAPISAPPRLRGRSHYKLGRTLDVLLDIMSLRFQAAYQTRPLRFLGRVGLFLMGAGGVVIVWLIVDKIVHGEPMGSRPPLPLAVLSILLGVLCLVLGFVAEMVAKIHYEVHSAKPYRVAEVLTQKTVGKSAERQ